VDPGNARGGEATGRGAPDPDVWKEAIRDLYVQSRGAAPGRAGAPVVLGMAAEIGALRRSWVWQFTP